MENTNRPINRQFKLSWKYRIYPGGGGGRDLGDIPQANTPFYNSNVKSNISLNNK